MSFTDKICSCLKKFRCEHKWMLLHRVKVWDYNDNGERYDLPEGTKWIYVCERCMKRKVIKSYED